MRDESLADSAAAAAAEAGSCIDCQLLQAENVVYTDDYLSTHCYMSKQCYPNKQCCTGTQYYTETPFYMSVQS